jgi:hypothetical protein
MGRRLFLRSQLACTALFAGVAIGCAPARTEVALPVRLPPPPPTAHASVEPTVGSVATAEATPPVEKRYPLYAVGVYNRREGYPDFIPIADGLLVISNLEITYAMPDGSLNQPPAIRRGLPRDRPQMTYVSAAAGSRERTLWIAIETCAREGSRARRAEIYRLTAAGWMLTTIGPPKKRCTDMSVDRDGSLACILEDPPPLAIVENPPPGEIKIVKIPGFTSLARTPSYVMPSLYRPQDSIAIGYCPAWKKDCLVDLGKDPEVVEIDNNWIIASGSAFTWDNSRLRSWSRSTWFQAIELPPNCRVEKLSQSKDKWLWSLLLCSGRYVVARRAPDGGDWDVLGAPAFDDARDSDKDIRSIWAQSGTELWVATKHNAYFSRKPASLFRFEDSP